MPSWLEDTIEDVKNRGGSLLIAVSEYPSKSREKLSRMRESSDPEIQCIEDEVHRLEGREQRLAHFGLTLKVWLGRIKMENYEELDAPRFKVLLIESRALEILFANIPRYPDLGRVIWERDTSNREESSAIYDNTREILIECLECESSDIEHFMGLVSDSRPGIDPTIHGNVLATTVSALKLNVCSFAAQMTARRLSENLLVEDWHLAKADSIDMKFISSEKIIQLTFSLLVNLDGLDRVVSQGLESSAASLGILSVQVESLMQNIEAELSVAATQREEFIQQAESNEIHARDQLDAIKDNMRDLNNTGSVVESKRSEAYHLLLSERARFELLSQNRFAANQQVNSHERVVGSRTTELTVAYRTSASYASQSEKLLYVNRMFSDILNERTSPCIPDDSIARLTQEIQRVCAQHRILLSEACRAAISEEDRLKAKDDMVDFEHSFSRYLTV